MKTLEDFVKISAFLKDPEDLPKNIDLFFFRKGEIPMWEESPLGGTWIIKFKQGSETSSLGEKWRAVLAALVGEQFGQDSKNVIGANLSLRFKEVWLTVWLKDKDLQSAKIVVSNKLRHLLVLDPSETTLYFKEHTQAIKDKSTIKNALGYMF